VRSRYYDEQDIPGCIPPRRIAVSATREPATADRLSNAILERQASIFDVIRSTSDRNHRFTRSLLESYRQGNRDWLEVGRRWVKNPVDVTGIYEAFADAVGNAQQRTLALSREWFEDAVESQRESRVLFRQGLGDAREAVERAGAQIPQFLRRNNLVRNSNKP
jgi:hypothetical protein